MYYRLYYDIKFEFIHYYDIREITPGILSDNCFDKYKF